VASDHGAHAVRKSGENHHGDMNEEKKKEKVCKEKVKSARSLVAAENGDDLRNHGSDDRRHGKSRDDSHRKEYKYDSQVGESLEDVVSVFFDGALETHMIENAGAERAPGEVSRSGDKMNAKVLRKNAGNGVEQAREHGDPG
jgi:hypothetical protein